jgi:hypothetical protein
VAESTHWQVETPYYVTNEAGVQELVPTGRILVAGDRDLREQFCKPFHLPDPPAKGRRQRGRE